MMPSLKMIFFFSLLWASPLTPHLEYHDFVSTAWNDETMSWSKCNLLNCQFNICPHDHVLATRTRPYRRQVFLIVAIRLLSADGSDGRVGEGGEDDDDDGGGGEGEGAPASKCPRPTPSQPPWRLQICFSSSPGESSQHIYIYVCVNWMMIKIQIRIT